LSKDAALGKGIVIVFHLSLLIKPKIHGKVKDYYNSFIIIVFSGMYKDQEQVLPELPCDAFRLGEPVHDLCSTSHTLLLLRRKGN